MLWVEALAGHSMHQDLQAFLGQVGILPALDPSAVVGAGVALGRARALLQGGDLALQEVPEHMHQSQATLHQ